MPVRLQAAPCSDKSQCKWIVHGERQGREARERRKARQGKQESVKRQGREGKRSSNERKERYFYPPCLEIIVSDALVVDLVLV